MELISEMRNLMMMLIKLSMNELKLWLEFDYYINISQYVIFLNRVTWNLDWKSILWFDDKHYEDILYINIWGALDKSYKEEIAKKETRRTKKQKEG